MKPTVVNIDGTEYELIPGRSQDALAVYLDVNIHSGETKVARLKLRCAVYEPEYKMIADASADDLLQMAIQREHFLDDVRSALHWQLELKKINPESEISAIRFSWFPENYAEGV